MKFYRNRCVAGVRVGRLHLEVQGPASYAGPNYRGLPGYRLLKLNLPVTAPNRFQDAPHWGIDFECFVLGWGVEVDWLGDRSYVTICLCGWWPNVRRWARSLRTARVRAKRLAA